MGDEAGADAARVRATRLEDALDWAQSLAPSPIRFETHCCGMSIAAGGDPFEVLGVGPPAVSARAADLLIVAGSLGHRVAPLVRALYERLLAPKWVIAWGACAISGGAYANYATIHGLGRLIPVDLVVPGCPPPVTALRAALEALRDGRTRDPGAFAQPSSEPGEWPILRDGGPSGAPSAAHVYGPGVGRASARRAAPPATDEPQAAGVGGEADEEEGRDDGDRD